MRIVLLLALLLPLSGCMVVSATAAVGGLAVGIATTTVGVAVDIGEAGIDAISDDEDEDD